MHCVRKEASCARLGIAEFEIRLIRDLLVSGVLEVVLPDYRLDNALTGKQIYMAYLPNRRFSTKVHVLREFLAERLKGIGELATAHGLPATRCLLRAMARRGPDRPSGRPRA